MDKIKKVLVGLVVLGIFGTVIQILCSIQVHYTALFKIVGTAFVLCGLVVVFATMAYSIGDMIIEGWRDYRRIKIENKKIHD